MVRYMLDTCIWRDFYEDRLGIDGRQLGKYASDILQRIIKNADTILISDAIIKELRKVYSAEEIFDMLNIFFMNGILLHIGLKDDELIEAKRLSQGRKIPLIDCLISIQARDHDAILLTQDRHILEQLSDIVPSIRPD